MRRRKAVAEGAESQQAGARTANVGRENELGREIVVAVRGLSASPSLGVVNALYAAAFELARRTGQTPRTVVEVCFSDAPSDEEWRAALLPFLAPMLVRTGSVSPRSRQRRLGEFRGSLSGAGEREIALQNAAVTDPAMGRNEYTAGTTWSWLPLLSNGCPENMVSNFFSAASGHQDTGSDRTACWRSHASSDSNRSVPLS